MFEPSNIVEVVLQANILIWAGIVDPKPDDFMNFDGLICILSKKLEPGLGDLEHFLFQKYFLVNLGRGLRIFWWLHSRGGFVNVIV